MNTKRKALISVSWLLVAVCMAIIFALSHQPASESGELSMSVMGFFAKILTEFIESIGHDAFRSIAHALEYCGLGLLLFNALYHTAQKPLIIPSFAVGVFYALTDEIHQLFIEGRAFQFTDILIDAAGGAVGVAAGYVIYKVIINIIKHHRGNTFEKE
ncbi:MAG: VanZ family protein [Clostridia bacterium]|nr:VanZ family protein [Clostridia bacterium]